MEVCEEKMRGRCPGVVSTNGDIREVKEKKIVGGLLYGVRILSGGLLYGFRLLSGGLLYGFRLLSGGRKLGRWAFGPITGQVYPKETTDSFLSRQEHGVCLLVLVVLVRTCIIRL